MLKFAGLKGTLCRCKSVFMWHMLPKEPKSEWCMSRRKKFLRVQTFLPKQIFLSSYAFRPLATDPRSSKLQCCFVLALILLKLRSRFKNTTCVFWVSWFYETRKSWHLEWECYRKRIGKIFWKKLGHLSVGRSEREKYVTWKNYFKTRLLFLVHISTPIFSCLRKKMFID